MADGPDTAPRRRILLLAALSLLVATLVTLCFVLPAEFQRDPTGFGRATGLVRLGAPIEETTKLEAGSTAAAHSYQMPFRTDTIEIPLAAARDSGHREELEYKVQMPAGGSFVYSWSAAGIDDPEEFYWDLHGETPKGPGVPKAVVVTYAKATGTAANGALTAPIDGVHGWYLQNQSKQPVTVVLKLAGFYELIPPGAYGNLAGIIAAPTNLVPGGR